MSISDLPLVLCGPMLRRVDLHSVSVFVALKFSRQVQLSLYRGQSANASPPIATQTTTTIAIGRYLHVAVITAQLPVEAPLQSGVVYSYTLSFTKAGTPVAPDDREPETADLKTLGLLNPQTGIVYLDGTLPSFVLPPQDLNKLRLIHGSCRKPHGEARDALLALDGMIQVTLNDPDRRPHQLFLTGDQIYADDVADTLLARLTPIGDALLGWEETLPGINQPPQSQPLRPGKREAIAQQQAGSTSGKAKSHLLSLGEFYAMYLHTWSPQVWPAKMPGFADVYPQEFAEWKVDFERRQKYEEVMAKGFRDPYEPRVELKVRHEQLREQFEVEAKAIATLRQTLPQVRRALANIPVYMIFDDHEITDDWYLDLAACSRLLNRSLGQRLIQNGLLAYAIFQAWGNTPAAFEPGKPGHNLLMAAAQWSQSQGKDTQAQAQIIAKLGIPTLKEVQDRQELFHPPDSLDWHYTVALPGYPYEVIVLDSRTWRLYPGPLEHAGLISATGFQQQFSPTALPSTVPPVTIVVAPAPVLGVPLVEAIQGGGELQKLYTAFLDAEAWGFNPLTFERLLANIFTRNSRVVVLSGDVHYGFSARLGYWATHPFEHPDHARKGVMAQLTSSAIKNETARTFPPSHFLHFNGYVPAVGALPERQDWAGWNLPPGQSAIQIGQQGEGSLFWKEYQPWLLEGTPARLRVNHLPKDSVIQTPEDWRYCVDYLLAENEENRNVMPVDVDRPQPGFPAPGWRRDYALKQYLSAAKNHQSYRSKWGNGKEIVGVNNLGEVTFQWKDNQKAVVHELWWWLEGKDYPFPLSKWVISLDPDDPNYPKPAPLVQATVQ